MLSDALTLTITFTMEMEAQLLELYVGPEIFDLFEVEIYLVHKSMWL